MHSTLRSARAFGIAAACVGILATAPASAPAQVTASDVKQQSAGITVRGIAEQLGTKIVARESDDLPIGGSFTGALADPAKLVSIGITGLHEGARVSVMRVGPDRLRIEVDELDPAPLTKKATLRVDEKGKLIVP
jgi:hypothetical protein